jgi:lysophospholipase L1-like esterase
MKCGFLLCFFLAVNLNAQSVLESGINTLDLAGCAVVGADIKITGTGNTQSNKAYFGSETTLDEIDMHFDVRLESLDSTGVFRFGIGKYSGISGTMVEFSGNDSSCMIIVSRMIGTTPSFVTQFPLPFTLGTGINYDFRIGKRVRFLEIEVSSTDTSSYYLNDSLSYPTPFFGNLWGRPFIGCHSGSISVSDFSLTTPFNTDPRLSVWGDSFVEGNSLTNVEDRYVDLIKDSIGFSNIAILGRGGENATSLSTRFSRESRWFKGSKYALVAIGVNDNSFFSWKSNMEKHLDSLKQHNIVPIIATLSPRADRLAFIAQVNNWVRNTYGGPYIDVNKAISANGTNWDSAMVMSDNIHPSVAGHIAIFERIVLEAPYIFRDTEAFTIDFVNEATNEAVGDSLKYSFASDFAAAYSGNNIPAPVIPGEFLYFKDTLTNPGVNIVYHVLSAPKRPSAPTNPAVDLSTFTFDWNNNPLFQNVGDYEYSLDSGLTWYTCSQKPIVSPGSNGLHVRVKATVNSFHSNMLFLDPSTGINPLASEDIKIYPNPFSERFIISNPEEGSGLNIYSADGRLLRSEIIGKGETEIDMRELRAGLYIIMLQDKSRSLGFRMIKQ